MPKDDPSSARNSAAPARDDDVLDMDQAVAFLKTTKPTLYRWINQGKVQGFKAGRQWRFYRRDLRKFLEYEDPTAAGIDLDAVRAAMKLLDKRIARARRKERRGDAARARRK
ncbi:MAG: helix-turn-helix domain-containing protein [Armatimonadota bacterium]|nr:MAG: helix-turn-helix domain-containing protein [Armatimonadota bacterium]